jgi:hypothetical protein
MSVQVNPHNEHPSWRRRRLAVVVALSATLLIGACSDDASTTTPSTLQTGSTAGAGNGPLSVDSDGVSTMPGDALSGQLDAIPVLQLTQADHDSLVYMREEERLAEDVYRVLYAKWQVPVFDNIAGAEVTHTASVKTLLDRYQLADPAAGRAAGTYQNATIQSLYTALVAQGSTSLIDALEVGAAIEDLDIADLQARPSDKADIALVYSNLEKGSRNHLRAFVSQLKSRGATYTPTHITQAQYDAIIAGTIERGSAG